METVNRTGENLFHVWVLEDSRLTQERLRFKLQKRFPTAHVRLFATRLQLEAAWMRGPRPDAVIIDLLVPDRDGWLIGLLGAEPPSGWLRHLVNPLRMLARVIAERALASYLKGLPDRLITGRQQEWGGVEFLRSRVMLGDQDRVKFYLYTIAANDTFAPGARFARVASGVMQYVADELRGLSFGIFPKGYCKMVGGKSRSNELVGDRLSDLLQQIELDLHPA